MTVACGECDVELDIQEPPREEWLTIYHETDEGTHITRLFVHVT